MCVPITLFLFFLLMLVGVLPINMCGYGEGVGVGGADVSMLLEHYLQLIYNNNNNTF